MADRLDSERLRGFCDRQTDRRTFAILESLSRLKSKPEFRYIIFFKIGAIKYFLSVEYSFFIFHQVLLKKILRQLSEYMYSF